VSIDADVRAKVGNFALDVRLHVDDGEMLAVLGPNGAGKSTLLRAIAGLLPLNAGRIVVDGVTVDEPAAEIFVPPERRSVGVMFQDYLLFAHLSALDNVAFGLRERGARRSAARTKARMLLDDVGMQDRYGARPRELSGGQAQRVALARALAVEPAVLLLDEPLAALDVQVRVDTRHQLREALARFGGARILVTHDPIDALTLADRLLILEQGRVVQEGTPDGVLERPRSPYVAELAGVNLYRGVAMGDRIKVGDGEHPQELVAADSHEGPVLAVIPPNAVVVSRQEPHGSARNVWPGTVATMERAAGRVRVRVSGVMPIVAEITPAAVGALELQEGATVWVSVKATEVAIHPD
jgi:molybdate transport system ATP-binding protein